MPWRPAGEVIGQGPVAPVHRHQRALCQAPGDQRYGTEVVRDIGGVRQDGVGVVEYAISSDGVTPACDGDAPDYDDYPTSCNAGSGCA